MKYTYIKGNRSKYSVVKMCHALQVSESGFYSWKKHHKSNREPYRDVLKLKIQELFYKSMERWLEVIL